MNLRFHRLSVFLVVTTAAYGQQVHSVENIFKPLGTAAELVSELSILTLVICAVIFAIVAGLLAYVIVRFRHRSGEDRSEPAQVYGSNQIEIAWTVIPILIVFVLTMSTARITSAVQDRRVPKDSVKVMVVGHRWWWEFRYPDLNVVTANELHIPLSTAARPRLAALTLTSADVTHSFWVPQLGGKMDLFPVRTNKMWIEAKELGVYLGNCAEYCGTQHANMRLSAIVDSPEDFDRWVSQQEQPAAVPGAPENQRAFLSSACIACHTVQGTPARGKSGPDLSHLMSRHTLASGAILNNPENLRAWIEDPQKFKPGNLMPSMKIGERQLDQMAAYLSTLQ